MAIDQQESNVVRDIKPFNRRVMGAGGPEDKRWPPWLKPLLSEKFFGQCKLHAASHKSECNMYCLDCVNGPICSLCLNHHKDHNAIQIRRSSYHDVIRVSEIQKHLDITSVQTYVINSAKVVFLNERPQTRPGKGVTKCCVVCDRGLVDSVQFCSIGCKIAWASGNFRPKVKVTFGNKHLMTATSDSEDSCTSNGFGPRVCNSKVRGLSPSTPLETPPARITHRRKGIPRRAPMGVDYEYTLKSL